jgi:quercetin dioxygenase-like cupin family protein
MKKLQLAVATALALMTSWPASAAPASHEGKGLEEIMTKAFPDLPGKEGVLITVSYAPGASDEVHRHDAHAFVYVLEGSIVMQVKGSPPVTLGPGQAFYEGPKDIHLVGRNASKTKPAKFVVFLVKDKGAALVKPAN